MGKHTALVMWCHNLKIALGLTSVYSTNILVCLPLPVFMGSGSSFSSFGETVLAVTLGLTWVPYIFSSCFSFLGLTCDVGFVPISGQGML